MKSEIIYTMLAFCITLVVTLVFLPVLLRWSLKSGFTDKPSARKRHAMPVPVVGGLGIVISLLGTMAIAATFGLLPEEQPFVWICMLLIAVTGVVDDRVNMSAGLRLFIEVACAMAVASAGLRIDSLHGVLGIYTLPLPLQYMLTILVTSGITNAFNLLDGIDGLAGSIAFVNCLVFMLAALLLQQYQWAILMAATSGSLVAFLQYNRQPARLFMGDGGSLFLGFLMSVTAIGLLHKGVPAPGSVTGIMPWAAVFSGCFMLMVSDTLRVFISRIRAGRSPFSADRTHLHHKLLSHFLVHREATRRILLLHLLLISSSFLLQCWCSVSWVLLLQVLVVLVYTLTLNFAHRFSRSYRSVRRMELQQ